MENVFTVPWGKLSLKNQPTTTRLTEMRGLLDQ